jgi:hypothetical protein
MEHKEENINMDILSEVELSSLESVDDPNEAEDEDVTMDILSEVEVSSLESVDDPNKTKEDILEEEQPFVDLTTEGKKTTAKQGQDQAKNLHETVASHVNHYFLKGAESHDIIEDHHLEKEKEVTERGKEEESYCGKRKRDDKPPSDKPPSDKPPLSANLHKDQHQMLSPDVNLYPSSSNASQESPFSLIETAVSQLKKELEEKNFTIEQLQGVVKALKSTKGRNDRENYLPKQELIKSNTNSTDIARNQAREPEEFILASKNERKLSPEWILQNIFLRSKGNANKQCATAKCSYCQKIFNVFSLTYLTDHVRTCYKIDSLTRSAYFNDLEKVMLLFSDLFLTQDAPLVSFFQNRFSS